MREIGLRLPGGLWWKLEEMVLRFTGLMGMFRDHALVLSCLV